MTETAPFLEVPERVSVLFHPSTVPVLDVFRTLADFQEQYDLALLDGPERTLRSFVSPEAAKAIVSDAILFGFALARQRLDPLHLKPLGSRHGSMDEYCLVALIASSRRPDSELTFEASAALGFASPDFMISVAADLVRRIDLSGLAFDTPSLSTFRAIAARKILIDEEWMGVSKPSEYRFRF